MFLGVAGALELPYLKLAASGPEISMNLWKELWSECVRPSKTHAEAERPLK